MLHAYADSDQRRAATTVGGIDIPVQATMTSRLKQAGTHCISAAWSLASLPVQCAYAGKIKLPKNWIISSVELHKSRCHYITVIIALYYITFALTCQLSERFNSFDSLITAGKKLGCTNRASWDEGLADPLKYAWAPSHVLPCRIWSL